MADRRLREMKLACSKREALQPGRGSNARSTTKFGMRLMRAVHVCEGDMASAAVSLRGLSLRESLSHQRELRQAADAQRPAFQRGRLRRGRVLHRLSAVRSVEQSHCVACGRAVLDCSHHGDVVRHLRRDDVRHEADELPHHAHFLGVAEAGFIPAILLYLTYWFSASRRSKVTALFMTGIPMSGRSPPVLSCR